MRISLTMLCMKSRPPQSITHLSLSLPLCMMPSYRHLLLQILISSLPLTITHPHPPLLMGLPPLLPIAFFDQTGN